MQRHNRFRPLGLLVALASATALAQTEPTVHHAHEAAAPPPAALAGYRPFDPDQPLREWRAVNDEAARLGGHGGQLSPAPAPAHTSPPHSHDGAHR